MSKPFPPEFRFGVATADHQCEAYTGQDDIRDVWEREEGLTRRGRATDFWNRYRDDVDLARGLGCRAFRLSLSWARLEPQPGVWDDAAFEHYRQVLQYLRDAEMATVVTLLHNTWPLHVQAAGDGAGLLDEGFPDRLAAFATTVAQRLGHLIDYYVTINEPNQLVYGFIKGWWMRTYPMPPGLGPSATAGDQMDAVLNLIPNLFRANARARTAIHNVYPDARVGANPLVLGLPRWLRRWTDFCATRLKTPDDLRGQAKQVVHRGIIDTGAVDISIAQLTRTQARSDHVLFSHPYFVAHLAALHDVRATLPNDFKTWNGRVGMASDIPPARLAPTYFPTATVCYYAGTGAAVDALMRDEIDVVFDDDVMLKRYASANLTTTLLPGNDQLLAVATALGSRSLLDAVNAVIPSPGTVQDASVIEHDGSLEAVRRRGVLRVGIRPDATDLCVGDASDGYRGLEPDLARKIAASIFGAADGRVQFVCLRGERRVNATRSWLQRFDGFLKTFSMFATILGTNWWNLGLAGRLAPFLCPTECVGALDFVGLDYYWGVPSLRPSEIGRLAATAECKYVNAPVWPGVIYDILREQQVLFPGKAIVVIENGCTTSADDVTRADYITKHLYQIQRAVESGVPVEAYLCWSITSNREWGLAFNDSSDFGLFHIDLDTDANLTRVPTAASARYAQIIAARSAQIPLP